MARKKKDYKAIAKSLRKFSPAIRKLDLRKPLTPHQKAWITRRAKTLGNASSAFPVSEKQARILRETHPDLLLGNGIRAIRQRFFGQDAKFSVNKSGIMKVKSGGKTFVHVPIKDVTLESFIAAGEKIFREKERPTLWLWTKNGRGRRGNGSLNIFIDHMTSLFLEGVSGLAPLQGEPEEFLEGIVYLAA